MTTSGFCSSTTFKKSVKGSYRILSDVVKGPAVTNNVKESERKMQGISMQTERYQEHHTKMWQRIIMLPDGELSGWRLCGMTPYW